MECSTEPGTYVLIIQMATAERLPIGALGPVSLYAGYYCYVGSAMGGLGARIGRHRRKEKRLHWHIDYVLQRGEVVEVWYATGRDPRECLWARALESQGLQPCEAPLGASDCACHTHLFYSHEQPNLRVLNSAVEPSDQARTMVLTGDHSR